MEECPGCGRQLPETAGDEWWVTDGDPLGCSCDGSWSADGEGAWPVHDDGCRQCLAEENTDAQPKGGGSSGGQRSVPWG